MPNSQPSIPAHQRRPILWGIVAIGAAILLLSAIWATATILDLSRSVHDCLDSRGACQRIAERRSQETQNLVIRVNAYSIACAQEPGVARNAPKLIRCVATKLARDERARER